MSLQGIFVFFLLSKAYKLGGSGWRRLGHCAFKFVVIIVKEKGIQKMAKCGMVHLRQRVISCVNTAIQFCSWDSWQDDVYFSQTNIPYCGDGFSSIDHVVQELKEFISAAVQSFKQICEIIVGSLFHAFCWISENIIC